MLINTALPNETISNPINTYPSIHLLELFVIVRLDQSKGAALIRSKVIEAMDTINRQLKDKNLTLPLDTNQERFYKRAVAYEAAALIGEDNLDYDTSTSGQIRGENGLTKSESLRRNVDYAIADLTNRPRNRVRLI